MSRVKVNSINPLSGQNINFGGHAVPSGSNKNLGSETNAWAELYVSTGSVNFVAPVAVGQPTIIIASLKAGGESSINPAIPQGQIFTETLSNLRGSFSVGRGNQAFGTASLAVGTGNIASGSFSLAQGLQNDAFGVGSHAEGVDTLSLSDYSHAEGQLTIASGSYSHAEGTNTKTSGLASHAEGRFTIASGLASHAEGNQTTASGFYAHAEGNQTQALGDSSHAEGYQTVALGQNSYAGGRSTIASGSNQAVFGLLNELNNTESLFVVGAGSTGQAIRKDGFSVEVDNVARPHIVIPTNTANPSNPKAGSMYFNPNTNIMRIWNGTTWRTASFG